MAGKIEPTATAGGVARSFSEFAGQIASSHGFSLDPSQERAVVQLEDLGRRLAALERSETSLLRLIYRKQVPSGIYLWGGVGRGKSFLMDGFFDWVGIRRKSRSHFHRFMQDVHHRLKAAQGRENPLTDIARDIAQHSRLLCLDEFHVTDIGDAMLMRNLLQGLFEQGVVLVTTSNQQPDKLYAHGLQRAQFLPAIDMLKTRLRVIEVDDGTDYRLRVLEKEGVYHHPLGDRATGAMLETFEAIAGSDGESHVMLEVEGRDIASKRVAPGVAWFEFDALCDGPRGTPDYIELARRYHTVLISGVRRFGPDAPDLRRRFGWLVDEFYDRRVKLILAAEMPLAELFRGSGGGVEAERTLSRLIEMQTRQYLASPHLS
jgi:cell division protein ZapE